MSQVGGQAVLGRQSLVSTPWLTERHGYDPTCRLQSFHHTIQSVAATGGVYKEQGHIQRSLMNYDY